MINITRRQFLQYCAASAAALGLSQTDLLKLEKALATPQPATSQPSPSVIWLSAQACSGCPVSLLNRMVQTGGNYYDADMLNLLYGSGLTLPAATDGAVNDPANHDSPWVNPLAVVNDAADLLVGDAVRFTVDAGTAPGTLPRTLLWSDDAAAAIGLGLLPTDTLLAAYLSSFPTGYVTLDWNATVMASGGHVAVSQLNNIRNGGGLLGVYLVVVDGAIPSADDKFCYVFDNEDDTGAAIIPTSQLPIGPTTANEALKWLVGGAGCLGVISMGTCASYGGIPGGQGNKTGAIGVAEFLATESPTTAVINVPGCPPHPDWFVYPAAYILSHSTFDGALHLALPTLDSKGRPTAVYSGTQDGEGNAQPFCVDCPNEKKRLDGEGPATQLGESGCLGPLGCKGPYTFGDCPVRQKNTADNGDLMNWCVGAQGTRPTSSDFAAADGIGEGRHPCQGCIEPDFPDWSALTVFDQKTSKKIKGFYNP